ncbi:MAG: apolipoprotein N-acyltransferase [Planctomycetes bacterium]|nr:apolipoprotein N-acyltransferase [Planctomycetota bacterium]
MFAPQPHEPLDKTGRMRAWLLVALSAVLITLAHHPANVPVVGFFAWAPLIWALPRLRAGGAFLAGLVFAGTNFTVNTWWLGQMATEPGKEIMIFLIFVLEVVVLSTKQALAVMAVRWLLTRQARWMALLIPAVWLGVEFVAELEIPATFPWLTAAMSVSQVNTFLQMADVVGAYGVGLCVVFINLAVASQLSLTGPGAKPALNRRGVGLAVAALILLVGGFAYGGVRVAQVEAAESKEAPLIGLVQGNLPQEVKVARDPARLPTSFYEHLNLSRQAAEAKADLVCWAETMVFFGSTREGTSPFATEAMSSRYYENGLPRRNLLDNIAQDTAYIGPLRADVRFRIQTPMLVGALTPVPKEEQDPRKDYVTDDRHYNTALLFDHEGRYLDSYDKRDLVPGGEYIPHEDNPLFQSVVSGVSRTLQNAVSRVEQGKRPTVFRFNAKDGREWRFTSSICYEYAFADCYTSMHRAPQGGRYPDFHVNISNEGWFKASAELDQAVTFCRLRCIENRMPMVRATNTGLTCTIDAAGRVRETLTVDGRDRQVQGLLMTRPPVLMDPAPTLYVSMVGRSLAWLSLAVTVCIMAVMFVGRVKDRRERKRAKAAAKAGKA